MFEIGSELLDIGSRKWDLKYINGIDVDEPLSADGSENFLLPSVDDVSILVVRHSNYQITHFLTKFSASGVLQK